MKKAIVTPIFKKGQPNDPTNYRPISVTSALAKLLEMVLCSQIREYLKCNHTLNDTQFGFRKHFSTTDALLYTTETIRTHVDKGKYVSGLFLDLSKAFDSISHPILIDKLGSIGFSNNASGLIQNYLTNRIQRVKVNNVLSDWITVKQGVPQGTILGPLLFLLYVNDISLIVPHHCQIIQYADDTFIFSTDDNLQEANKNVTIGAESLQLFFCKNQLSLNVNKTEYMVFCKKRQNSQIGEQTITLNNIEIKESNQVKYLGIYFDSTLSFKNEIKHVLRKLAIAIRTTSAIALKLPPKHRVNLLETLVMSHLNYSAVLLTAISESMLGSLEKQLNWGIRVCFSRNKFSRVNDLKLKFDILPVKLRIEKCCVKYLGKFIRNQLPAFQNLPIAEHSIKHNDRTKKLYNNKTFTNNILGNSFFHKTITWWNQLPLQIRSYTISKSNFKRSTNMFFLSKFQMQPNIAKLGKSWKDFIIN